METLYCAVSLLDSFMRWISLIDFHWVEDLNLGLLS